MMIEQSYIWRSPCLSQWEITSGSERMFQCCREFYPNSTMQRFCNTDCTKAHQQAEAMFSRLVKQFSEKEGVTEALKAENQMLWVQRMNHIRSAAMENVSSELIYC